MDASTTSLYEIELKSILSGAPADGATLVALLSTFDDTFQNARLKTALLNAPKTTIFKSTDIGLINDAIGLL